MSKKSDLLKSIIKGQITESPALDRFLKSRGLNPKTVTKDQKVAHSKLGQFKKWQRDHATDLTRMGEEVDKKDVVTFDIPLLIRVLELAREDIKSDMDLHRVVERLINMRDQGMLTMDDYDTIANIKENHIAIAMGNMLDDEGSMVLNQIEELERGCAMIRSYIGKDYEKQLPAWVQSKVTLATDYMSTVGNYLSTKNEEVEPIDEISKELTHSYLKKRYAQTGATRQDKPKGMSRVTHDKQLMGLNRATRRLTTTLELPKGTDPSQGGKYTADSVEINSTPIQEGSAALRLAQALRKEREARELKDKSREAAEKNEKAKQPTQQQEAALEDPQSATQSPYDCANNPDDTSPKGKKLIQMSKSARIIKSIYKRKGMKEEIYDTEKEGKSIATYGKKPKLSDNEKKIEAVGGKPQAAAIMTGGTTLTGTPRDTVEIDPMMKPPKPGSLGQSDKPKNNNR